MMRVFEARRNIVVGNSITLLQRGERLTDEELGVRVRQALVRAQFGVQLNIEEPKPAPESPPVRATKKPLKPPEDKRFSPAENKNG